MFFTGARGRLQQAVFGMNNAFRFHPIHKHVIPIFTVSIVPTFSFHSAQYRTTTVAPEKQCQTFLGHPKDEGAEAEETHE